jgi:hypothetical protein
LRIKDLRKVSTYPLVCLRFSQTLLHQDLGTFLRKKSLNLGINFIKRQSKAIPQINNQQSTINNQQSTINNQQSTINNQQ